MSNNNRNNVNGMNIPYSINTHSFPMNFPERGGVNNNNLSHLRTTNTESNMYPPNGQMNSNPFGNFNPMSTNTREQMNNWSHFKQKNPLPDPTNTRKFSNISHQQQYPLINKINHRNDNMLLHNNMGDNVMDEHIIEYRINIDSTDRDIGAYADPFHFKVIFNPPSSRPDKDGVVYSGPPQPHILKEFKNVKYVKLDNIILPKYAKTIDDGGGTHIVDTTGTAVVLSDDRYILLSIKEINNTFTLGTNKANEDSFATVIPDNAIGTKFFTGTPYYGNKLFKNSHLGNISTLAIDLFDSRGNRIEVGGLDTAITDENDARYPLFPDFQMSMSLIFGVVESQLNTDTKFEQ